MEFEHRANVYRHRLAAAEAHSAELESQLAENVDAAAELIDEFQTVRARWQARSAEAEQNSERVAIAEDRRDEAEKALAELRARMEQADDEPVLAD